MLRIGSLWLKGVDMDRITASATALTATATGVRRPVRGSLLVGAAGTVGHVAVTAWAAPLNFFQRDAGADPVVLADIFDRFAVLDAVRAARTTSWRPCGPATPRPRPGSPPRITSRPAQWSPRTAARHR
jgi:hypothetical protein